jgi:hypothetical protein
VFHVDIRRRTHNNSVLVIQGSEYAVDIFTSGVESMRAVKEAASESKQIPP